MLNKNKLLIIFLVVVILIQFGMLAWSRNLTKKSLKLADDAINNAQETQVMVNQALQLTEDYEALLNVCLEGKTL